MDVRMLNYKETGRSLEVPSAFGMEHRLADEQVQCPSRCP